MQFHRLMPFLVAGLALNSFCLASPVAAQSGIRVATYNIFFLKKSIPNARADRIKQVIETLDADVIGLQEIEDRDALERVFDPNQWSLVIDDDSADKQDVALAIRKPLVPVGLNSSASDLDADDDDFLFPDDDDNAAFPNRRDVLTVEVQVPGTDRKFHVMVLHAKARSGGRDVTDIRRENAARMLVEELERNFDGKDVIIVGDLNDTCDDRSLNILETGDPDMLGGPEQIEGPFMLNLTEALIVDDHCSWGLHADDDDVVLQTVVPGSRVLNNAERGTSGSVRPILFDQILISPSLADDYVPGSVAVFSDPVARQGGSAAPSDHVPVSAVFEFGDAGDGEDDDDPMPPPTTGVQVRIVSLLPDPAGVDAGNEKVTLKNVGDADADLADWTLRDRSGSTFSLTGTIAAGEELEFTLPAGEEELHLTNSGDEIKLLDAEGEEVHRVSYAGDQAQRGVTVTFDE